VERIPIAPDYVLGLPHFFFEFGVVRRELIGAIGRFDQKQTLSVARAEPFDDLLWQHYSERIAKSSNLQFEHKHHL
jgi:hypothetical protein